MKKYYIFLICTIICISNLIGCEMVVNQKAKPDRAMSNDVKISSSDVASSKLKLTDLDKSATSNDPIDQLAEKVSKKLYDKLSNDSEFISKVAGAVNSTSESQSSSVSVDNGSLSEKEPEKDSAKENLIKKKKITSETGIFVSNNIKIDVKTAVKAISDLPLVELLRLKGDILNLKEFINRAGNSKILVDQAIKAGVDKKEEFVGICKKYSEAKLRNFFVKQEMAKISKPTENEISDYYKKNIKNYISAEKTRAFLVVSENKENAAKAYNEIINGMPFANVAKSSSIDNSAAHGGDIGWIIKKDNKDKITKDDNIFDDSEKRIFDLQEYELSKPYQSGKWWIILKRGETIPSKNISLNDVRQQIIGELSAKNLSEKYNEFIINLEKKAGSQINSDAVDSLIDFFNKKETGNKPLFSVYGKSFSIQDLMDYVKEHQEFKIPTLKFEKKEVGKFIKKIRDSELITKSALKSEFKIDAPEFKMPDEKYEELLIAIYLKDRIKPEITEDAPLLYYNENKQKYTVSGTYRTTYITTDTFELSEEVLRYLKKGGSFEETLNEFSKRGYVSNKNIFLVSPRWISGENLEKDMIKAFESAEKTTICGPFKLKKGYNLFKILEKRSQVTKSFEEVKKIVENDLYNEVYEKLKINYINALRKKLNASVHKDALEFIFNLLKKKGGIVKYLGDLEKGVVMVSDSKDPFVIKAGEREVKTSDFLKDFEKVKGGVDLKKERAMEILSQWVKTWSLSDRAVQENLDKTSGYIKRINKIKKDHLIDQLVKQLMTPTDEEAEKMAKKYYDANKSLFEYVSVISCETDIPETIEKLSSLVSDTLKDPEVFSKNNLDKVESHTITRDKSIKIPDYFRNIFQKPAGALSGPFEKNGKSLYFYVIKKDIFSFEMIRLQEIEKVKRITGQKILEKTIDEMRKKDFVFVDHKLLKKDILTLFNEKNINSNIGKIGEDFITLKEIAIELAKMSLKDQTEIKASSDKLIDFVEKYVNTSLLRRLALKRKIDTTDIYKYIIAQYRDKLLAGEYVKMVESKFNPQKAEVQDFYDNNIKLFTDSTGIVPFEKIEKKVLYYMKKDFLEKKLIKDIEIWQKDNSVYLNRELLKKLAGDQSDGSK